jgi:hypothetical protein
VTAALELSKDSFGRHLTLEMLDRTLQSTFANMNFDGFALYGLDHELFGSSQERGKVA